MVSMGSLPGFAARCAEGLWPSGSDLFDRGYAPRIAGIAPKQKMTPSGKAQPFRTSGGTAANGL